MNQRQALKSIIDRLKRGEHVNSGDKSILELKARQARRVSNILKTFNQGRKREQDRLVKLLGSEEKFRLGMAEGDARVANYLKQEKRCRLLMIDKLEDMAEDIGD